MKPGRCTTIDFPPSQTIFNCDVLTVATGLPEPNVYAVDFIKAVAEVESKLRLRLLQLRLEQFVILVFRNLVYRELTRQVIIVAVTSRRCQMYPNACLPNAMRGYDEGTAVLSDNISCLRHG